MCASESTIDSRALLDAARGGAGIDRAQALAVLRSGPDDLLQVLDAAYQVRRVHWGRGVNLHVVQNAKSGLCRENCASTTRATRTDQSPRRP